MVWVWLLVCGGLKFFLLTALWGPGALTPFLFSYFFSFILSIVYGVFISACSFVNTAAIYYKTFTSPQEVSLGPFL